ncbi:RNA-directed DNA polymerase, eukaryota, reverse transcriptase zinc-binding domain protein, partial [Tanacetum coccineum]
LGNGFGTLFWEDVWRGETNLKSLYPRLFALESSKSITVASKLSQDSLWSSFRRVVRGGVEQAQLSQLITNLEGVTLGDMRDRWVWSMDGTGEFSVASVRKVIDDRLLPDISSKTKWVNMVPIKINIHAWKVRLDGLPTRLNLSKRGMDIESISCPLCDNAVESSSHIFFACHIARELFRKITRWWDINFLEVSSHEEWTDWLSNLRLLSKHKKLLEGYGRTYNGPVERSGDGKPSVGSNSQSVSINENVFQSFNSYAKAVLGKTNSGQCLANTELSIAEQKSVGGGRIVTRISDVGLDMLGGRWLVGNSISMDQWNESRLQRCFKRDMFWVQEVSHDFIPDEDVFGIDLVVAIGSMGSEKAKIRDDSVLYNDGCIKDCMEKNLEDDAGEILGVHSQGDCGNVTTDDNEDVTPVIF